MHSIKLLDDTPIKEPLRRYHFEKDIFEKMKQKI